MQHGERKQRQGLGGEGLVIGLGHPCPTCPVPGGPGQDGALHAGRRKRAGKKWVPAGAPGSKGSCTGGQGFRDPVLGATLLKSPGQFRSSAGPPSLLFIHSVSFLRPLSAAPGHPCQEATCRRRGAPWKSFQRSDVCLCA